MEIGQYIDFHTSAGAGNDYDLRLMGTPGLLTVQGANLDVDLNLRCGNSTYRHYQTALTTYGAITMYAPDSNTSLTMMCVNGALYAQNSKGRDATLWGGSQTITHKTNVSGEIGTFCEATGEIYDGYEKIKNTDCICAVKQTTVLNPRIVGIICDIDEFASHGDVLVKVAPGTYEIGDILSPDENGYGRKASEDEEIFMMMKAIPRPKITALNLEGYDGFVACFLV